MASYASYLVCGKYIDEVKEFLSLFFEERKEKYSHNTWITFEIQNSSFLINLIEGSEQDITQNMTFEVYCKSKEELENFAKKYNCEIQSFLVTKTSQHYKYYYIEIIGPQNICKIEISYSKDS